MHTFAFLHVGAAGGLSATQVPQGLPSGTGPAPHVHFPGGRLCREALKYIWHSVASTPPQNGHGSDKYPPPPPCGCGPVVGLWWFRVGLELV